MSTAQRHIACLPQSSYRTHQSVKCSNRCHILDFFAGKKKWFVQIQRFENYRKGLLSDFWFGTLVPFLNLNIKHRAEYVMAERHQVAICPHTLHTEQHEYGSWSSIVLTAAANVCQPAHCPGDTKRNASGLMCGRHYLVLWDGLWERSVVWLCFFLIFVSSAWY